MITAKTAELQQQAQAAGIPIRIHTGAEVELNYDTLQFIQAGSRDYCLAGSRYILCECTAQSQPDQAEALLYELMLREFVPILAHPERYDRIMLSKRLEEAKVAEVMIPNEVQVVDEATLPEQPIKPRKGLTMVLAMLLGLLVGTGFVVARFLLNRKIRTADDVEQQLGLPVLGMIPDADDMKYKAENDGILIKIRRKLKLWRK